MTRRMRGRHGAALAVLGMALALGACESLDVLGVGDVFKGSEERLPGERISVLSFEQQVTPDPVASSIPIVLPRPYVNPDWPQAGGYPAHVLHHLDVAADLKQLWSVSIGQGSTREAKLLASPVVAEGKVFALDADGTVSAVDAETGARVWQIETSAQDEDSDLGFQGGLSYHQGRLYLDSGFGYIAALNPADGTEVWRRVVGVPLRTAPTVSGGRVFGVSHDNQLFALNAETGEILWNHVGIAESAGLLGAASPAVFADTVIAPYSSGELIALRVENGRVAWTDTLTRASRMTPLNALNDISGQPVIDRGRVFALSHSGRMVSIDLRTGSRIWEKTIAGVETPWVAGDFIFVVDLEGELIAMNRDDGLVRWVTRLGKFEVDDGEEQRDKPIQWSGPVLAGDRLLVVSSNGYAVSVSPYTGEVTGRQAMPSGIFLAPVVANRTVYVLTDDAQLVALR
ncbi:outer membrane protein assembly factor BamB family protein [Zavarzinia sp. CC-PAN008]|uniref:outer membrane protein assembly factor BamB family protein n=1 Tax=Zavarzinia sp. CC-PAN008 TaxID=3243332 RepID=UPI003F745CA6